MKILPDIELQELAGEHLLVLPDEGGEEMSRVVPLDEPALYLLERLQGREFGLDDAVALLLEAYDVEEEIAREDVGELFAQLRELKVVE